MGYEFPEEKIGIFKVIYRLFEARRAVLNQGAYQVLISRKSQNIRRYKIFNIEFFSWVLYSLQLDHGKVFIAVTNFWVLNLIDISSSRISLIA